MIRKTFSLLVTLIQFSAGTCDRADIESMVGGYPGVHSVESSTFAVVPETYDLVVAGKLTKETLAYGEQPFGFVYYQHEAHCQIQWMLNVQDFQEGVQHVAFSPQSTNLLYGVAQGLQGSASFFWIKGVQSNSPSLYKQLLKEHLGANSINFHIEASGTGKLWWVTEDEIIYAQPRETSPFEWSFETNS